MTIRLLCVAGCALLLASCSAAESKTGLGISFDGARPGTVVEISANGHATQAGVPGSVVDVVTNTSRGPIDQVTLDEDGNLGVRGQIFSSVERRKDSSAELGDAVAALGKAKIEVLTGRDGIVRVAFRGTPPSYLAGKGAVSMDDTTSLVIAMAAINQLAGEVRDLQAQVAQLKH